MTFTVGCIVFLLMYDIFFLNYTAEKSDNSFEDISYINETVDLYSEQYQ